jgi:NADP-dependent 3-hydroxy acid dehydrogenase YdfG
LGTLEDWEKCLSRGLGEATVRLFSAQGAGGMLGAWRAGRTLLLAGEQEFARLEAV